MGAPARFSLCGFSLGGIVALEIVAQAPDRVERLALIGCNPGVPDTETGLARAALPQAEFAAGIDLPLVRDGPRGAARNLSSADRHHPDARRRPSRRSRIAAPTLVMCGAEDRATPPVMSVAIFQAIPQARLVIVPGAGHYLPLERAETVADQLAAWLATPTDPSTR